MLNQTWRKGMLACLAGFGWFAVITQLVLMLQHSTEPPGEALVRFISYFTIETNLLLASSSSILLLAPGSRAGAFFLKPATQTALTVYIFIVGLIYNTILRFLWEPTGMQQLVDELLHSVIPVLAMVFWLLFTPKEKLHWKQCFAWLIYPLLYIAFVLIRGQHSGFYPYPFIDTRKLGLNKVVANAAGIAVLFLLVSLALVFIARMMSRRTASTASD